MQSLSLYKSYYYEECFFLFKYFGSRDSDFCSNVKKNSVRYVHLFENVADTLIPAATSSIGTDIFDVLNHQRRALLHVIFYY